MSAPEIIILGGPPCSGKTTIGRKFAALETEGVVKHLSMGDHLRAIRAGEIDSRFSDALIDSSQQLKDHAPVPAEVPIGVFEEFIETEQPDLLVLDGFPRYPERVAAFRKSVEHINGNILAICKIAVPDELVHKRYAERPQRFEDVEEDRALIEKRLNDYRSNASPALDSLAADGYPRFKLDGTKPVSDSVLTLRSIQIACKACDMLNT